MSEQSAFEEVLLILYERREKLNATISFIEELAFSTERPIEVPPPPTISLTESVLPEPPPPAPVPESPPVTIPKLGLGKGRVKTPCPDCGRLMPAQGMANHRRSRHSSQTCPHCNQDFDSEDQMNRHKLTCSKRENICRFCGMECGSFTSWQEHEKTYCTKRLQERASTQHVHVWKLDTPEGQIVRGKCKTCGVSREFPSDPDTAPVWRPRQAAT